MKVDMEKVGTRIVTTRGKDLPRTGVHSRIIALGAFGRTEKVRNVPHRDRRSQGHGAVNDPVVRHHFWPRCVPEMNRKSYSQAREDGIDQCRHPQLASSYDRLHLTAVRPSGDVDPIV